MCASHVKLRLERMISDTEIANALRQDHKGDQLSAHQKISECKLESAKFELKPQNVR